MYKEHWEHSRHCEKEMFWFTNIYVAVVVAVLAFMRQQADFGQTLVLLLFGLILSVLGFFIMISLTLGYQNYIMNVVTICYRWNLLEFYANPEKPIFYKSVHRWLFEITIALFSVLLFSYGCQGLISRTLSHKSQVVLTVVFVIIVLGIAYGIDQLYKRTWRKYGGERQAYIKVLREDTEGKYRKEWDSWFKKPEFWKKITKDASIPKAQENAGTQEGN